jgi:tetratricopeptide (TPR) repeat protein
MFKRLVIACVILGSLGLLGLSSRKPWWRVPDGFGLAAPDGTLKATTEEPPVARFYKKGCLAVAGSLAVLGLIGRAEGRTVRRIITSALTATLLFPYLVTVWQPGPSARAAWLEMQHVNLTWLGGDIYMSGEFLDTPLKAGVYVVDTPRRVQIFDLPLTSPWDLDLNRLSDLLEWLGFTEPFCEFIGKGWILALLGLSGLLTAACVADRAVHRDRITHVARLAVAQLIPAAAVAWLLPFAAGHQINAAQTLARQGDYAGALGTLEGAGEILPIVREDTYYVAQVGLLSHLLGDGERPESLLYRANLLERASRYAEAADGYGRVLANAPADSACAREASRALLRCAIHDLNSGQVERAIDALSAVLDREPCNLKANFTLQLAFLRSGRGDELTRLVDEMRAVYAWFQTPGKKPVLSFAHHNLFVAALDAGRPDEALRQYRRSQRP